MTEVAAIGAVIDDETLLDELGLRMPQDADDPLAVLLLSLARQVDEPQRHRRAPGRHRRVHGRRRALAALAALGIAVSGASVAAARENTAPPAGVTVAGTAPRGDMLTGSAPPQGLPPAGADGPSHDPDLSGGVVGDPASETPTPAVSQQALAGIALPTVRSAVTIPPTVTGPASPESPFRPGRGKRDAAGMPYRDAGGGHATHDSGHDSPGSPRHGQGGNAGPAPELGSSDRGSSDRGSGTGSGGSGAGSVTGASGAAPERYMAAGHGAGAVQDPPMHSGAPGPATGTTAQQAPPATPAGSSVGGSPTGSTGTTPEPGGGPSPSGSAGTSPTPTGSATVPSPPPPGGGSAPRPSSGASPLPTAGSTTPPPGGPAPANPPGGGSGIPPASGPSPTTPPPAAR